MKHLLIVHHSQTGNTERLAQAAREAAQDLPDLNLEIRYLLAAAAGSQDLRWADGLLLATPENFGYMSGALKDFFDRTFYEVEGRLNPLPTAIFVSAGNDGSNAVRAIRRIIGLDADAVVVGVDANPCVVDHDILFFQNRINILINQ